MSEKTQQIARLPAKCTRQYQAGETIYARGEKATALYLIAKGQVLVHRHNKKSRLILRIANELLGEVPFFLNQVYEEDASANKDTVLIVIDHTTFLEQMMGSKEFCPHCEKSLSAHFRPRIQLFWKFLQALAKRIQALDNELDIIHLEGDTVRSALQSAEQRTQVLETERRGLLTMVSDFLQTPPLTTVMPKVPKAK